jgi:hypothetical protein
MERNLMSKGKRTDLLAEKESLQERSKHIEEDMLQVDSKSKQRYQQRKQRVAMTSVNERRVNRRKLGVGASRCLDTEDKQFITKCIEETCSAQVTVLFTEASKNRIAFNHIKTPLMHVHSKRET